MLAEFASLVHVHDVGLLSAAIRVESTKLTVILSTRLTGKHTTVTVCGRSHRSTAERRARKLQMQRINEEGRHMSRTTETFQKRYSAVYCIKT